MTNLILSPFPRFKYANGYARSDFVVIMAKLMYGLTIAFVEVRSFEMAPYCLFVLLAGDRTGLIQKLFLSCYLRLYWNTAKKAVQGQNDRNGYSVFRDRVRERISVCKW